MSIDDFYKYIMKKSLLCYDFHESEKSDIPLEEYLLTYNNEWFQVQESAYFYLHILGYKIEYVNKKKIINSCFEGKGNPLLVNSVLLGCEKVDTKIKLKIESYGQVKKVEIKLPQIEDAREKQSYIKNFGKKSIYLYIASFEKFVSSEDIEKCHSNEILYIDLPILSIPLLVSDKFPFRFCIASSKTLDDFILSSSITSTSLFSL